MQLTAAAGTQATVAEARDAWHHLRADGAVKPFEQAIESDPNDMSLKRGLLLAHRMNGHFKPQLEVAQDLATQHADNPYLLCVFEQAVAEYEGIVGAA